MGWRKYTIDGSRELESLIDDHMDLISFELVDTLGEDVIESLVLMGGYGRGEGAVMVKLETECVFNDYDFFVVTKRKLQGFEINALRSLAASLSEKVGIEVDLFAIDKKSFVNSPMSLMNYETQVKSYVAYGNKNILKEMPCYEVNSIPVIEGTRLLLNRGVLLLYCQKKFVNEEKVDQLELEKIIKYMFKATLALGDSYLLLNRNYHYSYVKKRLQISENAIYEYPRFSELKSAYLEAVDFKLKVNYASYKERDLRSWFEGLLGLFEDYYRWYEEQRLHCRISNWKVYQRLLVADSLHAGWKLLLKSIALNVLTFGPMQVLVHPSWAFCYPRTRLYAMLPSMLFKNGNPRSDVFLINENKQASLGEIFETYWNTWLRYS